jgi:endonuclease YncB( thermonuclease family)
MGTVIPLQRARMARKRARMALRGLFTLSFSALLRYGGIIALAMLMAAVALLLPEQRQNTGPTPTPATISVRVVDGDTLVHGGERIRLTGIDAPELAQTCRDGQARAWSCGQAAKERLAALVSQGGVSCSARGKDRYHRTLAICSAGGVADVGAALVRGGYAVNYNRYTSDYAGAEQEARAARRGIWQGEFERPESWRHRHPRSG